MELRPEKIAITVSNKVPYVIKCLRIETWLKTSVRLRSFFKDLFIRETIRNNVGVYRYRDEGIDRAILKQQCEIPYAIFGMFAGENGRTDKHTSRDSR